MAKKEKKQTSLLSESEIAKKYNSGRADIITLMPEHVIRIPTRILKFNYQLNGGLPAGKIMEEFGEESTGKSLLATEFAYVTQYLGGEVIWADAENSFERTWVEALGLDLNKIHLLPSENAVEMISDWFADVALSVRSRLRANEPILFVTDSISALECLDNINTSQMDAKAEMGNRAKAIYKFFRFRSKMMAELGISMIGINQLRKKVGAGMFEDPDTTPGGAAMKFYAHQRYSLVKGKQIKQEIGKDEVKVGQNVYIYTKKDKTGPPREKTEAKVFFTDVKGHNIGFDKYVGLADLLVTKEVLERSKGSSRYYYKGTMLANGEDAMQNLLLSDDELRAKLIRKSKINTPSRTKAQLESLTKNYYPVRGVKVKSQVHDDDDDDLLPPA